VAANYAWLQVVSIKQGKVVILTQLEVCLADNSELRAVAYFTRVKKLTFPFSVPSSSYNTTKKFPVDVLFAVIKYDKCKLDKKNVPHNKQ
jgi:hypothetical protein